MQWIAVRDWDSRGWPRLLWGRLTMRGMAEGMLWLHGLTSAGKSKTPQAVYILRP
jgi:hypothetical protein